MVYFVSDLHLGIDVLLTSKEREKLFCEWLDVVAKDATDIYLVGDLFDFWFEYKTVIPKGYVRLLGKLAELSDSGINIEFFIGNHDMWMFTYFEEELGIKTHREPIVREHFGKRFFIGHGDGLGPGDYGYKFLKKVFANKLCQWAFERIHPNFGIGLANFWSGRSREHTEEPHRYLGDKNEWLYQFVAEHSRNTDIDYYVFGHRHLPIRRELAVNDTTYINLGEWMNFQSYAKYDGKKLDILFYKNEKGIVYPE